MPSQTHWRGSCLKPQSTGSDRGLSSDTSGGPGPQFLTTILPCPSVTPWDVSGGIEKVHAYKYFSHYIVCVGLNNRGRDRNTKQAYRVKWSHCHFSLPYLTPWVPFSYFATDSNTFRWTGCMWEISLYLGWVGVLAFADICTLSISSRLKPKSFP